MTRNARRRNEKILSNVVFTNFDFVELSEIYIHSGELSRREILFVRECVSKINEMREYADEDGLNACRESTESKIAEMLGEARYRRLKLDMEMNTREFCERFLESNSDAFYSEQTVFEKAFERMSSVIRCFVEKARSVQFVKRG
jgi:hypothetical protein